MVTVRYKNSNGELSETPEYPDTNPGNLFVLKKQLEMATNEYCSIVVNKIGGFEVSVPKSLDRSKVTVPVTYL